MIEKIIFSTIQIALFTITVFKLIKKKDSTYVYMLVTEFIGVIINFAELIVATNFHFFIRVIMYFTSVIFPAFLFAIGKIKKVDIAELFKIILATIYSRSGNNDKAKTILNKFLEKNKNSYNTHKALAKIYEQEQNYEASISEYMQLTQINKNDLDVAYNLSVVLNKNKQNEGAVQVLQEILKQKPEDEKASNLLGDIFFEQEKYKEAVSVYMTALRYHPGSYDLYYNLGMAYTMINDFEMAKEFYEKAAQINTLLYNAKLNLGQIALLYGDLEEAEKYFRESMKQEDLEAGSYYYLSQIALLKGDEEKAKNYMNVAIQLDNKVYKQMQKDPIFIPIRNKIKPPMQEIKENMNDKKVLTRKEKSVNSHLVKTCILVANLSKEDLNILLKRKEKNKQIQKEERQKE